MLRYIAQELAELSQKGAIKKLHVSEPEAEGGYVRIRGKRVLDLTSWDLLGVSDNPEFQKAIHVEGDHSKLGASRSRLLSGTLNVHKACEDRIAAFFQTEASLLFSSKNQAVLSLITSLLSERDAVFVDELIQSPVVDASYLVNSQVFAVSTSLGTTNLEKELEKAKHQFRRFIFVEALSPITGKLIDIGYYLHLAERFDAFLLIDESYSLGLVGKRGAGILEDLPFSPRVVCRYGTLGGSAAAYGAFIAGPQTLIDYLINRSRTFTAENSLPPLIAAGISKAIDIVEISVSLRGKLSSLSSTLVSGLEGEGLASDAAVKVPVVCFQPLRPSVAAEFAEGLFQRGFLVEPLPYGSSRNDQWTVRVLVNSHVSQEKIDALLEAVSDIGKKLKKRKIELT